MITIKDEHILLDQTYNNAEAAIVAAGEFLVGHGLVSPPYIDSMLARQRKVSLCRQFCRLASRGWRGTALY